MTSEKDIVRHICLHGWAPIELDREKLAAQVEHLSSKPGCVVENCPCLDFDYHGPQEHTDEEEVVLVMDIKDSDWQANLFVVSGIICWLEFSSFGEDYPSKLPAISQLC